MKVLFHRKAVFHASLVVLGLLALFYSPLGFTPPIILIMVAIAAPFVIWSMLRREPAVTRAEILRQVDTPSTDR